MRQWFKTQNFAQQCLCIFIWKPFPACSPIPECFFGEGIFFVLINFKGNRRQHEKPLGKLLVRSKVYYFELNNKEAVFRSEILCKFSFFGGLSKKIGSISYGEYWIFVKPSWKETRQKVCWVSKKNHCGWKKPFLICSS